MTRPRNSSGTIVWINVFEHAICNIIEYPAGSSNATDSHNDLENEKQSRLIPNPAQLNATHRPKPFTPVFAANVNAPNNAPTPVAPIRMPRPRAPPCKIPSAKIGINTV